MNSLFQRKGPFCAFSALGATFQNICFKIVWFFKHMTRLGVLVTQNVRLKVRTTSPKGINEAEEFNWLINASKVKYSNWLSL